MQFVAKILDDVLKGTKPIVDMITKTYVDTAKQIQALYEKQVCLTTTFIPLFKSEQLYTLSYSNIFFAFNTGG